MRGSAGKEKHRFIFKERNESAAFTDGFSKTDKRFNKNDKICIVILVLLMAALIAVSPFIPDAGHKKIKAELTKAGYNVDGIDFTLIEKDGIGSTGRRIYQASEPIEYAAGLMVEQWALDSYFFTTFKTYYSVKPYPETPIPTPVKLLLHISQEDYELLNEQAGSQEVEDYIKQLIYNHIKEWSNNAS